MRRVFLEKYERVQEEKSLRCFSIQSGNSLFRDLFSQSVASYQMIVGAKGF